MRRVLLATVLSVAVIAPAQDAFGQCSITTMEINGSLTLCAVDGAEWEWSGPGGFTATTPCVDAIAPGTYTLRVWDPVSGQWSAPCSHIVGTPATVPICGIAGADTVCAGTSATWCGPVGDFTYTWTGPAGFASGASCVDVSAAGTYWLQVADRVSGEKSEPCTKTLWASECSAPQRETPLCPAPAHWWSLACGTSAPTLDPAEFERIAAGVDQRSAVWSYNGTPDGLCAIFRPRRNSGSMASAKRHYAAVLANLTAGDLGVTSRSGDRIGLEATLPLEGVTGAAAGVTLGDWISATEATLLSLSGSPPIDRAGRDALRRIQHEARKIHSGSGPGGCGVAFGALLADPYDEVADWGEAFNAPPAFTFIRGTVSQGPLSGSGRLRWTLMRAEQVELAIVDITGRHVRRLASGAFSMGTHDLNWDGRDDDGRALRPGAYFVAGRIGDQRLSQRLIVLR